LCSSLYQAGTATAPYLAYNHTSALSSDDTCPTANGSSITGLSFYTGSSYPAQYNGALFFEDHSRNCIWVMTPGSNGLPSSSNLHMFEASAGNPVDLETGPNGDLFYADLDGKAIHRITYSAGTVNCSAGSFDAQYFNNMTLSGSPTVERCESSIN